MEEKILTRATFGGKFIVVLAWILSALLTFLVFIAVIDTYNEEELFPIVIVTGIISFACAIIIGKIFKSRELIVTNKRVVARTAFGYRLDLPLEKVTSVSTYIFNGITCSTPSAKINFQFCKNKKEVFDTIISETLQRDSKFK